MSSEQPSRVPRHAGGAFNPRKATAPIAAFAMAVILYTYSVSSIRAAKRNAQLHREADGGQVDMRKESLRRHGVLEQVEGTRNVDLFRNARVDVQEEDKAMGANQAQPPQDLGPREESGNRRTEVESGLQDYKGLGKAVERFKKEKGT